MRQIGIQTVRCHHASLAALLLLACDRSGQAPPPSVTGTASLPASAPAQSAAPPSPSASAPPPAASGAPRFPKTVPATPKLSGNRYELALLKYLPDGAHFVSTGRGGPVYVWEVDTGKVIHELEPGATPAELTGSTVYFRGDKLIICRNNHLKRWDPLTGVMEAVLLEKTVCGSSYQSLASPDGRWLAWGDGRGFLHVFDETAGTEQSAPSKGPDVMPMEFLPGNTELAADAALESKDRKRQIWSLSPLKLGSMKPAPPWDSLPTKSPDGAFEVRGESAKSGDKGFVHVFAAGAQKPLKDLAFHFLGPSRLLFTPDSAVLIAIGGNSAQGQIRVWKTATWEQLYQEDLDSEPLAVAMSPDGGTLLTGGFAGNLRFRDARTGKLLQTIDTCPDCR